MIIYRFMSKEEFRKFSEGQLLVNVTKHKNATNSEGFCFLNIEEYSPEVAMHFLSGIVNFDVCAVFETNVKLKKTYGRYHKPIKRTGTLMEDLLCAFNNCFEATEYYTEQYSKKNFKLIKYIENVWEQYQPVEEQKELRWKINGGI